MCFPHGHPLIGFVTVGATIPMTALVVRSMMHTDCDCSPPPRRWRAVAGGFVGGTFGSLMSKIDAGMVFDITMMVVG